MAIWDDVLTERDRHVLANSGQAGRMGFGMRPALLIVDAQESFVGLRASITESIKTYPRSMGEEAWTAVDRIAEVLEVARRHGFPVYYSQSGMMPGENRFDNFGRKQTAGTTPMEYPGPGYDIVAPLKPRLGEVVLQKRFASPFLGTPLPSFLISDQIDTLLICGFVTAGCVRAAVVDASGYSLRVGVIHDGCCDRMQVSHKATLLDIHMKYGDVVTAAEANSYLTETASRR